MRQVKRCQRIVAVILMALMSVTLSIKPALADAGEVRPLSDFMHGTATIYLKSKSDGVTSVIELTSKKSVSKMKSSKKSVVEVGYYENGTGSTAKKQWYLVAKKAGSAKLTFTYGGKKYSTKIKVKKWVNPVSSLKIGSKNYGSVFKRTFFLGYSDSVGAKDFQGMAGKKLKVKAKSGWKIKSITYTKSPAFNKARKLKNGSKVPSNYHGVTVILKNKSNGGIEQLYMY